MIELFYRFGTALAIGFLIGLQREFSSSDEQRALAGVRTFSLMALVGATVLVAALVALTMLR